MAFITIVILFLFLAYSYWKERSFIAPAVITSLVWFVMLIIYNTVDHGLYTLSDHFYYVVLVWNVGFTFGCHIISPIKVTNSYYSGKLYSSSLGNFLLCVMIICLMLGIYGSYLIGKALNPSNIFAGIRAYSVSVLNGEENLYELPVYVTIARIIASYSLVVIGCIVCFEKKISLIAKVSLLLLIIYTLFKSNKASVVQVIFFFFVLLSLRNRINKKLVIYGLLTFVVLMIASHLMRAGEEKAEEFSLTNMIASYLLSPLPAFDYASTAPLTLIDDFHGEYTFRAFIPYVNLFGYNLIGNEDPFNLHFWTNTPLPVNVYTVLFSFYTDYGILGVFVGALCYGLFYEFFWKGCKKNIPIFQVSYASLAYILYFQFFIDFLMTYFWVNILNLVFIVFFFTHIKFRAQRMNPPII